MSLDPQVEVALRNLALKPPFDSFEPTEARRLFAENRLPEKIYEQLESVVDLNITEYATEIPIRIYIPKMKVGYIGSGEESGGAYCCFIEGSL